MIGIIDYGMGNLQSVKNSFEYIRAEAKIVRTPAELQEAGSLVLPGVGSFAEGMRNLEKLKLVEEIKKQVTVQAKPFLGICLGMQLLADRGTEGGDTPGLGLIPGTVKRLDVNTPGAFRLPHVGWNNIKIQQKNSLLSDDMAVDYYFVHSYYFETQNQLHRIAMCDYEGKTFEAVVGSGNIFGAQFHPEKSHQYGLKILKNFATLACLKNA